MKKLLVPLFSAAVILLSLVGSEFALRIFLPISDPYQMDKFPRYTYIRSQFRPNMRLYTEVEPDLPGVQGRNLFTTNNIGFRGGYLKQPKPQHEFRIFMVGGSTIECLYLDDSTAINAVLESQLNKHSLDGQVIRVYNSGKSGDFTPDHIAMIVHRIVHLEPDMIILLAGANDLFFSIIGIDYSRFLPNGPPKIYTYSKLLRLLATEFQIARRFYYLIKGVSPKDQRQILQEITERSNYREKIALMRSKPISAKRPRVGVGHYKANLRTIAAVAKTHGIRLIFMTQASTWNSHVDPTISNWHWLLYWAGVRYRETFMNEALELLNDAMREVAFLGSIPIFDLAAWIPKSSIFFYDDVHFNVKGADTVGIELAKFILGRDLTSNKR